MTDFDALLKQLAKAKLEHDRFVSQHERIFDRVKTLSSTVKAFDQAVREAAIRHYEETGDKSPHRAAYIKMQTITNFNLPDNISAAIEEAPHILEIDPDQFAANARDAARALENAGLLQLLSINNRSAKKLSNASWMKVDTSVEPVVNIKSDLSSLLESEQSNVEL